MKGRMYFKRCDIIIVAQASFVADNVDWLTQIPFHPSFSSQQRPKS